VLDLHPLMEQVLKLEEVTTITMKISSKNRLTMDKMGIIVLIKMKREIDFKMKKLRSMTTLRSNNRIL